jgi:hypothetical protein
MDLVDKIKELFELYDEYGSEMPEVEINFIKLLVSKAQSKGLSTDMLSPDEVSKIHFLHNKYSKVEAYDSDESVGGEGQG